MLSSFVEPFKLIMIEDDEGHALLIRKNLERSGITNTIIHLKDGNAAIEYFFTGQHDRASLGKSLVLLDLNLPGADGYEILRRLKEDERTRRIPVIMLTTTDNPREIDRCYAMGCNIYITKPVEYDRFSEAIRRLGQILAIVKVPHA